MSPTIPKDPQYPNLMASFSLPPTALKFTDRPVHEQNPNFTLTDFVNTAEPNHQDHFSQLTLGTFSSDSSLSASDGVVMRFFSRIKRVVGKAKSSAMCKMKSLFRSTPK